MSKFFLSIVGFLSFSTLSFAQAGSIDTDFGSNGTTTFIPQPLLNKAYGIALQPDQKILIAGYALSGSANVFELARLMPNGTPDSAFGTDGLVQMLVGSDAVCYAIALQPDGKILLAGGASSASNGSKDFTLLRFLPNGSLDSTFSGDGIQTISFGIGDDIARAVILQPDEHILIAGTSTNGNNSLMAIARVKPNGTPDATFSGDGKNTLAIGTIFTNAYAMALLSDGKIMLAGAAKFGMSDDIALARFLPSGVADVTFGISGHIVTDLGSDADSGNAITIQDDGKMLVVGITGATRDFALLRYLPNGTLDPNFANQGHVLTDFAGSDDYANAVLLQSDGKILVGGYAYNGSLPDFAMARYLSDGTIDPNFGLNGLLTTDFSNGYDYGFPMAIQLDGKLLQAGYSYSNGHTAFAVARYISGLDVGLLDPSASNTAFISPNPVHQTAIFEFGITQPGVFTLSLSDVHGQQVQTFFRAKQFETGRQSESLLFSSNLPAGWYLLQLNGEGHQWTIKILKD
jgi:uncharacterized delta-60 repeat protein